MVPARTQPMAWGFRSALSIPRWFLRTSLCWAFPQISDGKRLALSRHQLSPAAAFGRTGHSASATALAFAAELCGLLRVRHRTSILPMSRRRPRCSGAVP